MVTKRRVGRGARIPYGSGHVFQMFCGRDFFNDGFGTDMAAMKAAWPALREAVYELVQDRLGPDARPWGSYMFDRKGGSVEKREAAWEKYRQERSERSRVEAPRLA